MNNWERLHPESPDTKRELLNNFSHHRYVSFLPHPRFFLSTAVVRKEHCCGKISF